jgi:hypothetical protein
METNMKSKGDNIGALTEQHPSLARMAFFMGFFPSIYFLGNTIVQLCC